MLGSNHRLPLFHMAESFIWIEETKERINIFLIRYMINSKLNTNKAFRKQVFIYLNIVFIPTTQYHIGATLAKKTTRVGT